MSNMPKLTLFVEICSEGFNFFCFFGLLVVKGWKSMGSTSDNILNLLQKNSAEIQSNEAPEAYGATRLTLSVIF
jgi:hypothetical protein